MSKLLSRVNDLPSRNIGRRSSALVVAVLVALVISGASLRAEGMRDCVREYEDAMAGYWNDLWSQYDDIMENYSWYDPRRVLLINGIGWEYQLRVQSADLQLFGCSSRLT